MALGRRGAECLRQSRRQEDFLRRATAQTAAAAQADPTSVGLILMNTAQSHFPDVAWLIERFPEAPRVFTSTSRSVQAQMCLRGRGLPVLPRPPGDATTGLQRIETRGTPPTRDTRVGYHQDLRDMDRLRAMLEITDKLLGGEPPGSGLFCAEGRRARMRASVVRQRSGLI